MADLLAAGKAIIDQFVATLPEELRGSAQEIFSKAEAQNGVKLVGEAALMRSDYSKQLDAVQQEKARAADLEARAKAYYADLEKWHADNADAAKLGRLAKQSGWSPDETVIQTPATPKPADLPPDVVRAADLDQQAQLAVKYMNTTNRLTIRHFREFGEDLNVDELITDPRVKELGIEGVYQVKFKDRYEEKAKQAREADWAKREEAIRADERKKVANRPLHPVAGPGSPLDVLESLQKPGTASVEDMTAEYERLVAAKA